MVLYYQLMVDFQPILESSMEKNVIYCVDSDGCAMDTMTYKHQLFFGPLAAEVFEVDNREDFLREWDRVNLFSINRGINRFVGLVRGLEYAGISNISSLKKWVEETDSLSNVSLEKALQNRPSEDLNKALDWSLRVNQAIKTHEGPVLAFQGVRECFEQMRQFGEIVVVSSANKEAVMEEWEVQGLLQYVSEVFCQDRGLKSDIIASLIGEGAINNRILMIGDSVGDLEAAKNNEVAFYPIMVGKEEESWEQLREEVASAFARGDYSAEIEQEQVQRFWKNLDS